MSDDEMMELPPLRMAMPAEYESLAKALFRYGQHAPGCYAASSVASMGIGARGECACGLEEARRDARRVVAKLAETLDQELAREKRGSGLPPPDGLY